jgi:hypothetical protein
VLEALVGIVVGLLILTGVLVLVGPSNLRAMVRRARSINRPTKVPAVFQAARSHDVAPAGLNPKTQRVLVGAARLANWLRTHGHDDLARELRAAAARMTANEPAGLYAMQTVIRKVRAVGTGDGASQERLNALANELRTAVQDRFEQLELLPFKKP